MMQCAKCTFQIAKQMWVGIWEGMMRRKTRGKDWLLMQRLPYFTIETQDSLWRDFKFHRWRLTGFSGNHLAGQVQYVHACFLKTIMWSFYWYFSHHFRLCLDLNICLTSCLHLPHTLPAPADVWRSMWHPLNCNPSSPMLANAAWLDPFGIEPDSCATLRLSVQRWIPETSPTIGLVRAASRPPHKPRTWASLIFWPLGDVAKKLKYCM